MCFPGKFLDQEMTTQNQLHFKSLLPILYTSSFQFNNHSVKTHMHHKASYSLMYRSGMVNSNTVNSKFHLIQSKLKPPYSIAHDKLQLVIWDTSFWTFLVKFGHKRP